MNLSRLGRILPHMRQPRKSTDDDVPRKLVDALHVQSELIHRNHTESMQHMSALSDQIAAANAALDTLTTDVQTLIAKANSGGPNDDDVAAAQSALADIATKIGALDAQVTSTATTAPAV